MTRRLHVILAAVACVVMLATCGGPSLPALTDPREIVTGALTSTEAATSFHVDVAADGTVSVQLPIAGGAGIPINLTGATASVDVDVADTALSATFSVPASFGIAGELISVDGKTYLKTTLTGAQYQVLDLGTTLPIDPTDTAGLMDNLGDLLFQDGLVLTKGGDVPCGTEQCYTVTTNLTADQLPGGGGAAASGLPVNLAGATVDLTLVVEKDLPYHLAGLEANVGTAGGDSVKVELTFSKWDEPMTIAAPPSGQVKAGG